MSNNIPRHGHGPLHFSFTPAHLAIHGLPNDFPSSPQTSFNSKVQRHALLLGVHKLRARRTMCKSVFFQKT